MTGQFDLQWQAVEASDPSKILTASQKAAEAYNQAIKDQIKVADTMFNNAQQHKMNEVQQAMDALSLEEYNAPDARAKFDELIANKTQEIGGFNAANQLTLDTIWDKRGDTLVDRNRNALNLESQEYKVGGERDNRIITDYGNTVAAMELKIAEVAKLPVSEQRDTLLSSLQTERDNYVSTFEQTYPHLAIGGKTTAHTASNDLLKSKVTGVENENSYYDAMVTGIYPQFSAYVEARKEVGDRYAGVNDIEDPKEKANKIAERDSALNKVDSEFSDISEGLKDPRMLAALNKKLKQDLNDAATNELEREKRLAEINALDVGAQATATNAQANMLGAQADTAEVAAGIQNGASDREEAQKNQAAETNKAVVIASAKNVGLSENFANEVLGTDGRIDNNKAVAAVNTIGKALTEEYNLGAPKGANEHMSWRTSKGAQPYVTDFEDKVALNPYLKTAFDELSKNLSGVDKTLLYMGIATMPIYEVELINPNGFRSGTTREKAATNLITQARKSWKASYMLGATSVASKRIDWVASQQGMDSATWLSANKKNLNHIGLFQSPNLISAQLSPPSVDNWSRTPPPPPSNKKGSTKETGKTAQSRVTQGKVMSGGR